MSSTSEGGFWLRAMAVVAVVFTVVLVTWALFAVNDYTLEQQASAIGIVKDLLTITALLVGALWTMRLYVRQRTDRLAVAVEQRVEKVPLTDGRVLLKVFVTIRNIGKVFVHLSEWRLRADLLLPVVGNAATTLGTSTAFPESKAPWIAIAGFRDGIFQKADFDVRIEPNESDVQLGNLVIPVGVEVVQVYSHFPRPDGAPNEGWSARTIVNLRKGENDGHPDHSRAG